MEPPAISFWAIPPRRLTPPANGNCWLSMPTKALDSPQGHRSVEFHTKLDRAVLKFIILGSFPAPFGLKTNKTRPSDISL